MAIEFTHLDQFSVPQANRLESYQARLIARIRRSKWKRECFDGVKMLRGIGYGRIMSLVKSIAYWCE